MNKNTLITVLHVLLGNAILAFVVNAFVIPAGLVMGGATGLGLTINYYVPSLDLSVIIFGFNIVLFGLGALVLGKKFAVTTILSTIFYPLSLEIISRIPGIDSITENVLLAVIYAGILLGLGIGIIIRAGASTGGSDIIALIINKGLHIPVAICMYIVDFTIIGVQIPISTAEELLYGILALILCTVVLGRVTVVGQAQIQLFIISDAYQEIRSGLLEEMEVGATLVRIETGLEQKDQSAVLCVIPNRKLHDVKVMVQKIDSQAFFTITQINEVKGRGFSIDRYDKTIAS
ncbi:MAG: YitT family protein [Eubacteriales bacterium]